MDSIILLLVLPFFDGLNLLKEVGVSVIFVLDVLERFTPDLSGFFKLTTRLEPTVLERMLTVSIFSSLIPFLCVWNWNWRFYVEVGITIERCVMNQDLNDESLINQGS